MNSPDPKPIKTNQKGEIISWDGKSLDGELLKLLVTNGQAAGKTPTKLMKDYPQFKKYNCKTLSSALTNLRKSFEAEVTAARGGGSSCKCFNLLFAFLENNCNSFSLFVIVASFFMQSSTLSLIFIVLAKKMEPTFLQRILITSMEMILRKRCRISLE
jgi:hypothetical protein